MNLFPKSKVPYLIVSPSYTYKSSGVRTLHLLCHALNELGEKAYIIQDRDGGYALDPSLNTPLLSPQHYEHLKETQKFIAVYPDIMRGNPLNAEHVVHYLLAPVGKFGGDSEFPAEHQVWGALPALAEKVLRIPVSDTNIFYDLITERSGSCFYSHKYEMHGNQLLDITKDSIRLEGSLEYLADILRRSEVCYLYELSSVITESALCGCPVVLVKTPYFDTIDSTCMMGDVTWSDGQIVKSCQDYSQEYNNILHYFEGNLKQFIQETQELL